MKINQDISLKKKKHTYCFYVNVTYVGLSAYVLLIISYVLFCSVIYYHYHCYHYLSLPLSELISVSLFLFVTSLSVLLYNSHLSFSKPLPFPIVKSNFFIYLFVIFHFSSFLHFVWVRLRAWHVICPFLPVKKLSSSLQPLPHPTQSPRQSHSICPAPWVSFLPGQALHKNRRTCHEESLAMAVSGPLSPRQPPSLPRNSMIRQRICSA